jgi:hypothetical protein
MNDSVEQRARAYENNPDALQQRYAQNQQLIDLLALQKLKSEKEAAARDIQLKMGQRGKQPTIAEQREKEVGDMTRQEVAQQTAGTMQQKQQEQQQALQQVTNAAQGAPAGLPSIPQPGMMTPKAMAAGGIVAFEKGGNEGLKDVRNDPAMRIDPKVQKARDQDRLQILLQELKDIQQGLARKDPRYSQTDLDAIRREIRTVDPKLGRAADTSGITSVISSAQAGETQPAVQGAATSSSVGRGIKEVLNRIGLQSEPSPQALEANRLVQERQRLLDEQAKVAGSFGFRQQNAEDIAKYERIQADLRRNMQASQAGPAAPTTVPTAEKYTGEGMAGEGLASIPTSPPVVAEAPAAPAAPPVMTAPAPAPAAPAAPAVRTAPPQVQMPAPSAFETEVESGISGLLKTNPQEMAAKEQALAQTAYGRSPEEIALAKRNREAVAAANRARFDPDRMRNDELQRTLLGMIGGTTNLASLGMGSRAGLDYRTQMQAEQRQRMLEEQKAEEGDFAVDRDIRGKAFGTREKPLQEGLAAIRQGVASGAQLVDSARKTKADLLNAGLNRESAEYIAELNLRSSQAITEATRAGTLAQNQNTLIATLGRDEETALARARADATRKAKVHEETISFNTDSKSPQNIAARNALAAINSELRLQEQLISDKYADYRKDVLRGGGGSTEGFKVEKIK